MKLKENPNISVSNIHVHGTIKANHNVSKHKFSREIVEQFLLGFIWETNLEFSSK